MPQLSKPGTKMPKDVEQHIEQGRREHERRAIYHDEEWEFYRGNHYAYVDDRNRLRWLPTVTSPDGTGKPPWKARTRRNMIFDGILRITSLTTERRPDYGVIPTSPDPDRVSAARLSEKVLTWGYDRWEIGRIRQLAVLHALVASEAFAWPYFDNTIGPLLETEGGLVAEGDIRIRLYGASECYWEPGLPFEDSPWHVVEQAREIKQVESMGGYLGGKLSPDASARNLSHSGREEATKPNLVLVQDYLERPSGAFPQGRWFTIANRRVIADHGAYPSEDGRNAPVLRRLIYAPDPDSDRAISLVRQVIDPQRTHNDAVNKQIEWKNHSLQPRVAATPGVLGKQRWTDEPGKVFEVVQPNENLKVIDVPNVPEALFRMAQDAREDIGRLLATTELPQGVESGQAIEARMENDRPRTSLFTENLARFDSQIGHDCLALVQKHYTEDRLIQVKGDFSWESIPDFRGVKLRDQIDVRVSPDSIEPKTRSALERRVMQYAELGWVGPEDAMTAIETGTSERVLRSLAQDEARIGRIIQRIKEGPDVLFAMPNLPTGRMLPPTPENPQGEPEFVPGWMPRPTDNLAVWRVTLSDWMKTEEFEELPPEMQNAAAQIYAGVLELEAQEQQRMMEAQAAQAEDLGMRNASKPQEGKRSPSLPGSSINPSSGPPRASQ